MRSFAIFVLIWLSGIVVTYASEESIVEKHGLLRVNKSHLLDKHGEIVSLAGNSFFWSQWDRKGFWNEDCVRWLANDWRSSIIRLPMGVEDPGGYLENPKENERKVRMMVDAAIEQGLYVIIDWHSHKAEDSTDEAVDFFTRMAKDYGKHDNVIYEIYNEPKGSPWSRIKKYAEKVISAIRKQDPDNLIIVGSGDWSQKVDDPAKDPIKGWQNIAYSLHFYSAMHGQWLRDRADDAMEKGIALFVTEWGPVGAEEEDVETANWMAWCRSRNLSHCAWSVNDKVEPWSIVKQGADPTGGWSTNDLTASGKLQKALISNWSSASALSTDKQHGTDRFTPAPESKRNGEMKLGSKPEVRPK